MPGAMRNNEWKLEWSLVDFDSLEPMVQVLQFWAIKYERNDWKKGFDKDKLIDSILRHAFELKNWQELDDESELAVIGHLLCNCMFYSYHYWPKK